MKRIWQLAICLWMMSGGSALLRDVPLWIIWIKYITLAFAIFTTAIAVLQHCHAPVCKGKTVSRLLYGFALMFMMLYSILCLDTFVFYAITWFPGVLRYPIFDAYGIAYLVFIIPGLCYYLGQTTCEVK